VTTPSLPRPTTTTEPPFASAEPDLWASLDTVFTRSEDGRGITSAHKPTGARGIARSRALRVPQHNHHLAYSIAGTDFERHTCLDVVVDGQVVCSDTGRGPDRPRTASFDLQPWAGKDVLLEVRDLSEGAGWIEVGKVFFTETPISAPAWPVYAEPLRPVYHFTARQWTMRRLDPVERQEGWLNDLNGLVVVDGEFHLFAQRWNKCWIHAVSTNLVHWTELPPAFWEDDLDQGVQSGSCVVDVGNTSGLGEPGGPAPMIAFWSRNDNLTQGIHYSLDRGRTWQAWAGNPIMHQGERDPMVLRDHRRDRWCMVLYANRRYELLISTDLLHWEPVGDLGPGFECPDFFELPIEDGSESRWVLVRGDGSYEIGAFDGAAFVPETPLLTVDGGPNFYATQSWNAATDGVPRRVQMAWVHRSPFPGMPFSQQVTIPCDLALRSTPAGLRLHRSPAGELTALERREHDGPAGDLAPDKTWSASYGTSALRLRADLEIPAGAALELDLCGRRVVVERDRIAIDGTAQPTHTPVRQIDILLDVASVEVFANQGEASLTAYALSGPSEVRVTARHAPVTFRRARVAELDSIWPRSPEPAP